MFELKWLWQVEYKDGSIVKQDEVLYKDLYFDNIKKFYLVNKDKKFTVNKEEGLVFSPRGELLLSSEDKDLVYYRIISVFSNGKRDVKYCLGLGKKVLEIENDGDYYVK